MQIWFGSPLVNMDQWALEMQLDIKENPMLEQLVIQSLLEPDETLDFREFTFPSRQEINFWHQLWSGWSVRGVPIDRVQRDAITEPTRRARRALLAFLACRFKHALPARARQRLLRNQTAMIKRVRDLRAGDPILEKLDRAAVQARQRIGNGMGPWAWATYAAFPEWLSDWDARVDVGPGYVETVEHSPSIH